MVSGVSGDASLRHPTPKACMIASASVSLIGTYSRTLIWARASPQFLRGTMETMAKKMIADLGENRGEVHGYCDDKFRAVQDAFIENFHSREEQGASVCLSVDGETVVDLWGGMKHPKQAEPWQEDTICVVHSCTKAAVSLCAHVLIAEGKLNIHAPVTDYWPEFGQAGKDQTTVEMLLNHQVGLAAFREPLKQGGIADWDYMVERTAAEAPFWEPGTRHGYQMTTYGWTVGELVRRVSGQSLGDFFGARIASSRNLDFHIGLPDDQHHRVSRLLKWAPKKGDPISPFTQALLASRESLQNLAFMNNGGHRTDSPEGYRVEYGAAGGVANARGIAGMYQPLALGGEDLVDADILTRMQSCASAGLDATLLLPSRFSLGFMLSMDNRHRPAGALETVIMGGQAFGHAGAGGSLGFADTECRLGFGYTMNKMGAGILVNERGQALVDAAYRSLGYRTNEPGSWVK